MVTALTRAVAVRREGLVTTVVAAAVLVAVAAGSGHDLGLVAGALVGLGVVALAARHPVGAVAVLVVYVPLQQTLLAALYAAGLPAAVVRAAGFGKEAIVAGVLLHALALPAARRRPLTVVDAALLAFVALVVVYFLVPFAAHGALGGQSAKIRLYAVRLNVLFLLLAYALRRMRLGRRDLRRLEDALLLTGGVMALGGLWEAVAPGSYAHVITDVIRQPAFVSQVLGGTLDAGSVAIQGTVAGTTTFTRNGSFILDATTLGFFLITPFLLGLRRVVVDGPRWGTGLVTVGTGVVLVLTVTRSALLGAALGGLVVLAVALVSARVRRPARAPRTPVGPVGRRVGVLAALGLAALLLAAPFLGGTALGSRVGGAVSGQDVSTQSHGRSTSRALHLSAQHPLGLGLGADPASGAQLGSSIAVTSEDAYLQVAVELGWAGVVLFVVVFVGLLVELGRRVRRGPPDAALAVLAAGIGLGVGGLFLHVWLDFQTSLTFFALVGAACAAGPDRVGTRPHPAPAQPVAA